MRQLIMRLVIIAVSIFLISTIAIALQLYGTSTNKTQGAPAPSHVMTADEFSSRANAVNQQTKANLAQQVSSALPKQLSQPAAEMQNPTNINPQAAATPTEQQPAPVTTVVTPIVPPSSTPTNPVVQPLPPTNTTITTAPPAPQNQPYTGFGTGNTTNSTTNSTTTTKSSSGNNSGGWNIKY